MPRFFFSSTPCVGMLQEKLRACVLAFFNRLVHRKARQGEALNEAVLILITFLEIHGVVGAFFHSRIFQKSKTSLINRNPVPRAISIF